MSNNGTPAFVETLTPGTHITAWNKTGTVVSVTPVSRSKNLDVRLDIGGDTRTSFRMRPADTVVVLDALPTGTARAADHQPVDSVETGTQCTCGFVPKNRPTRSSMWNAPYNRHMGSLGLMPR